jgi:hypothetical protein
MNVPAILSLAITSTIAGHSLVRRIQPGFNSVLALIDVGFPVGALLVSQLGRSYGWLSLHCFAGTVAFAFFCELYIFIFTLVIGSVSAAILLDTTSPEKIANSSQPPTDTMLRKRLNALRHIGVIASLGSSYYLTQRGRLLVSSARLLRRFFSHDRPV